MTGEYRPTVELGLPSGNYEVSGFENEDEAREFIQRLDEETTDSIEVMGPY